MTNKTWWCWLLCGLLLAGCGGGGDDTTDGGTTVADSSGSDAASDSTPASRPKPQGIDLSGELAEHSVALSMLAADHFAVAKLDMASLRESPLMNKIPGGVDGGLKQATGSGFAGDLQALSQDIEVIWVAAAPGTGEWGLLTNAEPQAGRGEYFVSAQAVDAEGDLAFDAPVDPPMNLTVYIRFASTESIDQVKADMSVGEEGGAEAIDHHGETYFKEDTNTFMYPSGERELYVATEESRIHQIIDNQGVVTTKTPLLQRLSTMNVAAPIVLASGTSEFRDDLLAVMDPQQPGVAQARMIVENLDALSLAFDPDDTALIDLDLDAIQGRGEQLKQATNGILGASKLGLMMYAGGARDRGESAEMVQLYQLAMTALNDVKLTQSGERVDITLARPAQLDEVLTKAVEASRGQVQKMQAMNNGKQIALAQLNYQSAQGKFAGDLADENGAPILSWRVAVLPMLEQQNIYDQVDTAKSWDADENAVLRETIISVYEHPWTEEGMTTWKLLPVSKESDVMLIEGGPGSEVPWAQPDGFALNPQDPLAGLGEQPEGGYVVVTADGATYRVTAEQLGPALARQAGGN